MSNGNGASWYAQGGDGAKREEERRHRANKPDRFYLKDGTSKEFVFVDHEAFEINEHNLQHGNSWMNWFTCARGVYSPAVCCAQLGAKERYYIAFRTGVDVTGYVSSKDQKEHRFQLKFYASKFGVSKKLRAIALDRAARGGITNQVVSISRHGDKVPNSGDTFDFVRDADMEKLFELTSYQGKLLKDLYAKAEAKEEEMEALKKVFQLEFDDDGALIHKLVPFNYYEILQPMPEADLRDHVAFLSGGTSGGFSNNTQDDVPF